MPGIYVAAVVAALIAMSVIGALVLVPAPRDARRPLILAFLLQLPMSAGAYYLLRMPLDAGVQALGPDESLHALLASLYAPVTEEPVKLLPLLIPAIWAVAKSGRPVIAGLALGLGFGVGEIGFLAWLIAQNEQAAQLPFYVFTGFIGERVLVAFLHGAMTATAIWFFVRGRWWGILVAMAIHYALNFPVYLASLGTFGWGREIWLTVGLMWVVVLVIVMGALLVYFQKGRGGVKRMFGATRECPGCGESYKPGIVGLNLVMRRYERCPHCRKWHFV